MATPLPADLSPLAWGGRSLVALALGSSVALWSGETQRLLGSVHLKPPTSTCSRNLGLFTSTCSVTSVSWSRDGSTLALGTGDGEIQVQLWDVERSCKLRSISGHLSQVGALAWNQHLLSSGSLLGSLHHHDVRVGPPVGVARLQKCVCGLEWSPSGQRLASGTTDGLLCIWPGDPGAAGRNKPTSTIPHPTAVKALGWCPWKSELVAVGGGKSDGMLRIWDTNTETCLESTATNSQICSLRWSSRRKELLTAHGLPHNQIIRWAYPTLAQQAQLQGEERLRGRESDPERIKQVIIPPMTVSRLTPFSHHGCAEAVLSYTPLPAAVTRTPLALPAPQSLKKLRFVPEVPPTVCICDRNGWFWPCVAVDLLRCPFVRGRALLSPSLSVLCCHTGRVLHMALSPCESWILSCGSDQQACLWSSELQDDLRPESPSAHPNPGALQCVSAPSSSEQPIRAEETWRNLLFFAAAAAPAHVS
ncbi:hypothetical protein JZ751_029666 [Albula glossodonta]|uniref:CDC20/Fizzy WD40 domain-containing protein n=1 Tax=Albula glossodonta TaxID=121402 RepID=A0A8T2NBH3_9TELE|nr:hypothetical protein JZ751_029666 [Albula glossodonta]